MVARLSDGAELFPSLRVIMKSIDSECGMIVSGIGMLTDFKLGYFDRGSSEYIWEEFNEPMELLSLNGSFTNEGSIHLHAQVSGKDHDVKGGHLDGGRVFNVNEITMVVFDDIDLTREIDDARDTTLLTIR